jgi:EAL domain-containing protein (putative c-di-GMP-specific phosphodiesterase class I)
LIDFSKRILGILNDGDTLARLGGDEFAILLESAKNPAHALSIAEAIRTAIERPFVIQNRELFITASLGLVTDTWKYREPAHLLRDADTAMYRAKATGKNRCEVFDMEMHHEAKRRLDLEIELKRALENDEFTVFYQAIVDLFTGKIAGFEALVRWNHRREGMISPGEFIPVAEETGLIVPLGRNVLFESCKKFTEWKKRHDSAGGFFLSANLSHIQFSSPSLFDDIRRILAETGTEPQSLKLEITESGIMENVEESLALMLRLKQMGIKLSIDDFGTGYSSLSYLPVFPFDYLKVDRSFVMDLETKKENLHIVKTIIALAHDLGKKVIAEGIETGAHLEMLRKLGCDFGQGFFFSRPLPSDEAEKRIVDDPVW